MADFNDRSISRRDFLCTTGLATGALLMASADSAVAAQDADPYGGFKMCIQSYSLRNFDTETALQQTQDLGLKFWEAFRQHIPLSTLPAQVEQSQQLLDKHGVRLLAYGVMGVNSNESEARQLFDFAQAMNLVSISVNPAKDETTFDLLDKLVEEYSIPVAIHNHGPGAEYDKIADVEFWTRDRNPLIGACVDTGHYLRSDEDPVEAIERLGTRLYGVHLKDVKTIHSPEELDRLTKDLPKNRADRLRKEGKVMTILGEGELDIVGCLQALRKQKYDRALSLEYEENPDNPLSDIEVCLKAVRTAVDKL